MNKNERNKREARILEISQELNQRLAKRRHDVSGIMRNQSSKNRNSQVSNGEDLIVDRHDEGSNVLRLRQVMVETVIE